MRILVTGASGFIGKNLIVELKNKGYDTIYEYDIDKNEILLEDYCQKSDFIFHLAGINRSINESDFIEANFGLTSIILGNLKKFNNKCPIMISSSIQAEEDTPYGLSKKAGEELVFKYADETGVNVFVYRFANVFGKWCKPNYNSVIATFCYNISRDLPILINNPEKTLSLTYIDDIIIELLNALNNNATRKSKYCEVPVVYQVKLDKIATLIRSFKDQRENLLLPYLSDEFTKKLYSTYLSYLPIEDFSYSLKTYVDERGSFTEFIKTVGHGQVSINVTKPGMTKGNHWHHSKNEKFIVVNGEGVVRLRKVTENDVIEYYLNGKQLKVIDIPVGYVHHIQNVGDVDLVTVMWVNELFDENNPDTYYNEVVNNVKI